MFNILFAQYGEFNRKRKVGPVTWPHFDIFYLRSGKVYLIIGETPIILEKDQAVLIAPDTPFKGHSVTERSKASVIHFTMGNEEEKSQYFNVSKVASDGFNVYDRIPYQNEVTRDIERIVRMPSGQVNRALKKHHLLSMILLTLGSVDSFEGIGFSKFSKLGPLIDNVRNHPEKYLSTHEMAKSLAISQSHLRRVFKSATGLSPWKFVLESKMEKAGRLLREGSLSIKEIAFGLGYDDLANFYRAFKHRNHMSPGAYRKHFSTQG